MAIADKFFSFIARDQYKTGRLTSAWLFALKEHFERLVERREVAEPNYTAVPSGTNATATVIKGSPGRVYGIRVKSNADSAGVEATANASVDILDGTVIRARVWCKVRQSSETVYLTEDNGIECGTSINVVANQAVDGTTDLDATDPVAIDVVWS